MIGCYTSGASGQLVVDNAAGTAVVERDSGHRYAVTWPLGYTGRSSWGGVDGGYWTDGSFLGLRGSALTSWPSSSSASFAGSKGGETA